MIVIKESVGFGVQFRQETKRYVYNVHEWSVYKMDCCN